MTRSPCSRALMPILLLSALAAAPQTFGSVLGDDFNQEESHDYNGMPKLRLVLEGGYSQWMFNPDSLSPSYERYLNTLETGWNAAAEIAYFPWPKGGIGLTWIWFLSKAHQSGVTYGETNTPHVLSDRASFVYYGPTFLSRLQFGRFGLLVGGFSIGWLDIHHSWQEDGIPNRVTAGDVAVAANVGWEYAFYRFLSLGINGRALLSNITEYTYNGEKMKVSQPDDPLHWRNITMSRFELDLGIRFGL